jgi:alpha-tubulin suppressor-like RCC1 family protein
MNLRSSFSSVAVHLVFLSTDGKLYSWGPKTRDCLGHGRSHLSNIDCLNSPERLSAPELYDDGGFKDFAAGEHHNLLLTNKSRIFVWGRNEDGQLGLGHLTDVEIPTPIPIFPDGKIPARVHCGAHFSAVLTEDGSVYTMGYNNNGQLANGSNTAQSTPKKVDIPTPVIEVTCGWSFVLALTKSGQVYGWGYNRSLQLGERHAHETSSEVFTPTLLSSLTGFVRLQAGANHAVAIHEEREKRATINWGENTWDRDEDHSPHSVLPQDCQEVAAGYYSSFVLMKDGSMFAWGTNAYGKLGIGDLETENFVPTPRKVLIPPETSVACFGAAADHSFFISEAGDLYLWGNWDEGKLGMDEGVSTKKVPTLLQNWKWELPKSYIWAKWKNVFQWLWVGRLDKNSLFYGLYVEIVFNFISIY